MGDPVVVKNGRLKKRFVISNSNLLLAITVFVFFAMYIGAIIFLGYGFRKPNSFCNILNENAGLIILSCGMSLVMITGGIDISVGMVTALITMSCAVHLDYQGGNIVTAALIALGIGVAFSVAPLLLYQGALTLLAGLVGPLLSDAMVLEMSAVGGTIIMGIGFNMLFPEKHIPVGDMLPAIFLPILYIVLTGMI